MAQYHFIRAIPQQTLVSLMNRRPVTIILFIIILFVAAPPPFIASASSAPASPCLVPTPDDFSTQPVNPGFTSVILPGHVAPSVKNHQAKYVTGLVSNQRLNLDLVFKIRNYASFTACLASIQDPASPNFRNFLNAEHSSTIHSYTRRTGLLQVIFREQRVRCNERRIALSHQVNWHGATGFKRFQREPECFLSGEGGVLFTNRRSRAAAEFCFGHQRHNRPG